MVLGDCLRVLGNLLRVLEMSLNRPGLLKEVLQKDKGVH